MKITCYLLALILGCSISAMTQNSSDLVGRWKWEFFIMDKKATKLNAEDYLILNEDGSFINECKYGNEEQLHICDAGKWKLNANRIIRFDHDTSDNGVIQHSMNRHIYKLKKDTLVINSKEGLKDIFIYYIRQK